MSKEEIMFNLIKRLFGTDSKTATAQKIKPTAAATTTTRKPTPKPSETKKSASKTGGLTKSSLGKMTKVQLEDYAKKEFKVDLDRRKKKQDLVDEVIKLSKKSSK